MGDNGERGERMWKDKGEGKGGISITTKFTMGNNKDNFFKKFSNIDLSNNFLCMTQKA